MFANICGDFYCQAVILPVFYLVFVGIRSDVRRFSNKKSWILKNRAKATGARKSSKVRVNRSTALRKQMFRKFSSLFKKNSFFLQNPFPQSFQEHLDAKGGFAHQRQCRQRLFSQTSKCLLEQRRRQHTKGRLSMRKRRPDGACRWQTNSTENTFIVM